MDYCKDDDDDDDDGGGGGGGDADDEGGLRTYHIRPYHRLGICVTVSTWMVIWKVMKLPNSIIARYHCFILGQKDSAWWHSSIPLILLLNHQSTQTILPCCRPD